MNVVTTQGQHLVQGAAVGPQVFRMVRRAIVRGDLIPGTRVSETEIAKTYDVSRQPVREAFIRLADEGLVEVRPQRGTFVSLISVPLVLKARFIREAVEADIVRHVAKTADAKALALLDSHMDEQRAMPADAPADDFLRADEAFHRTLAELASQAAVADHLEGLKTQMNRVRHITARKVSRDRLIAQHLEVVEAIRAHDSDRASDAMRAHLREILLDLPGIVGTSPEYFEGAAALADAT
jgi:DNA-binding GntR family transcriptional regulator